MVSSETGRKYIGETNDYLQDLSGMSPVIATVAALSLKRLYIKRMTGFRVKEKCEN